MVSHCVLLLKVPEGVQNTGAEVSELQLMAENQTNLEVTTEQDNNNDSPPHTGWEDTHMNAHTQWVDRYFGLLLALKKQLNVLYFMLNLFDLYPGWSQFLLHTIARYTALQQAQSPQLHINVDVIHFDLYLHSVFRLLTTIILGMIIIASGI